MVTVQRRENNRWVTEGSCSGLEVYGFSIPARSQLTRALVTISPEAGSQSPIVSEPIPPHVFEGNLQDLPTSTAFPLPPVDVPEGAIALPISLLQDDLPAGTYRIEFSFIVGHPSGSVEMVYSANFDVVD